ncbi:LysM peptidoglycan-binding domain-containing protein [Virgibacillus byunsanensis]|uniref:LysM peptidoglycan-binding domain-containing protein n=1 Tax=Virgibacillus byunsanensis TaxID=570945 RepID=A0ABW3LH04_9BACI
MRKKLAALVAGVIIAGMAGTYVSAEEYEVIEGDTLWGIANEYDTTVEDLVDINDLKSTTIHPKQKLFINETYVVERGDTLSNVSKEYEVSVDELKEWNHLKTDLIVIGQELEIKGTNVVQEGQAVATTSNENQPDNNESTQNTEQTSESPEPNNQENPEGKTITVSATAYTAGCDGCSGITSTGVNLNENPNAKVIAVDPSVIPLGSEVYVEGYGYATAADIGSAIKGNKIDLHVPTKDEAFSWGVRTVNVTILNK